MNLLSNAWHAGAGSVHWQSLLWGGWSPTQNPPLIWEHSSCRRSSPQGSPCTLHGVPMEEGVGGGGRGGCWGVIPAQQCLCVPTWRALLITLALQYSQLMVRSGHSVAMCNSMSFSSPHQLQPWSVLQHNTFTMEISLRLAKSGENCRQEERRRGYCQPH